MRGEPVSIRVDDERAVSAIFSRPASADGCYVLAHGAGAGMMHPFMTAIAEGLADRGIASLRYQFPYMEQGAKRPDRPTLAYATVSAAVQAAARLAPDLPLFAGGKSFGGRMTSQAQAEGHLPTVRGIVFFGFPLHAARKPSNARAEHLAGVTVPMLFLQGSRDDLADLALLRPVVEKLGPRATRTIVDDADHSFHVRSRSGRTDQDVLDGMLDAVRAWLMECIKGSTPDSKYFPVTA